LTQSKAVAAYFEEAAKASGQAKLASNWVTGELARRLNADNIDIGSAPVSARQLAVLIKRVYDGKLLNNGAKQMFDMFWTGSRTLVAGSFEELDQQTEALIETEGLSPMSDTGELEAIIDTVLASNAKSVEEYKAGNAKAFNALVGQAMKATKGKGNPAQVNELLKKKLG
jgi:aspartyl-tRNA(Asn)/glutamyl-tRNA(Gln) amidotransferase subunit B